MVFTVCFSGGALCCRDFFLALDPFSSATSLTRSFVILQGSFQTHHCGFELALNKRCCASQVPCPRALEHSTCNPNSQQTKPLNVKCLCVITWQKAVEKCLQPQSHRNRLCLKNHPQQVITLLEKVKVGLVDSSRWVA